jgi:hypothetical protein
MDVLNTAEDPVEYVQGFIPPMAGAEANVIEVEYNQDQVEIRSRLGLSNQDWG